MSRLRELCENNTKLSKEDIDFLEVMEMTIGQMALLEEADIYIDCLTEDQKALVVAEAKSEQSMKTGQPPWLGQRMRASNEPAAYRALTEGVRTRGLDSVTENGCQYIQTAEPIVREGRVIGVLLREQLVDVANDIRERNGSFVRGSGGENIGISEFIDEGIIVVNSHGKVESVNKSARKIYERLGYDTRDMEGIDFEQIKLMDMDRASESKVGDSNAIQTTIDGIHLGIQFFYLGGKRRLVILKDLTAEAFRESELATKSLMLHEVHHRIKNDLQMVASFLSLQKRRTKSAEARDVLEMAEARVISMASTHELFSREKEDSVSFHELMNLLRENTDEALTIWGKDVEICFTGEDLQLNSKIAGYLSMIMNELVQNAVKHAFKGRKKGIIEIRTERTSRGITLLVADDGIGFDVKKSRDGASLGLQIVRLLTEEKLESCFELESDEKGTRAVIQIPDRVLLK